MSPQTMRRLALAATLLGASTATAEVDGLNAQQWVPAIGGSGDFLTVRGADVLPHMSPVAGAWLNWSYRSLVFSDGVDEKALIANQWQLDGYAAMTVWEKYQVGLAFPLTLYLDGDAVPGVQSEALSGMASGDLRIENRWAFGELIVPGLRFVGTVDLTLPLGQPSRYQGEGNVTLRPGLGSEWQFNDKLRLGANLSYLMREETRLDTRVVGNQLLWSAAAGYKYRENIELLGEAFGRFMADGDIDGSTQTTPLELTGAARWLLSPAHTLTGGMGLGVNTGLGTPALRLFVGYAWQGPSYADRDGDGLNDVEDKCPDDAEDRDGFEDTDGCPEMDNDQDGILEPVDACPNEPEDRDGFADADGCPDVDNDGDGTLDKDDKCPDVKGPPNRAGCPNLDLDNDGILDKDDKCPNRPEDRDGFQDDDGCPDHDNDRDGILDKNDRCPNEAETPNDFEDDDGCPDQAKVVEVTAERLEVSQSVHFKFATAELTAEGRAVVNLVADALKAHPEVRQVEIQGHTDDQGPRALNQTLSANRAGAVRDHLIAQGIAPDRLQSRGFGSSRPVNPAKTLKARAENRRVEFHITTR
jgi:outer membrane protein OmpA-like peptidoglycan-associated protein